MKDMENVNTVRTSTVMVSRWSRVKSRITLTYPLLTMLLMLTLGGLNSVAFGQTYKNGAWWSLYDDSEYSADTWQTSGVTIHTYSNIFVPNDGTFSFEAKLPGDDDSGKESSESDPHDWGVDNFDIKFADITKTVNQNVTLRETKRSGSGKWYDPYKYTYYYTYNYQYVSGSSFGTTSTSAEVKYVYKLKNTLRKVYIHNVHIPAAKHILLNDGSTNGNTSLIKNFSDTKVEATSAAQTINFRSFLTDTKGITITLTNGDAEVFRLGTSSNTTGSISSSMDGKSYNVGANACASGNGTSNATASGSTLGDISKYGFNVYFYPKAATNYTGTITITDGTSTATVTVNGTGVLNENAITWNPNTSNKKNWGDQVDANATATNNESGCPAITYSVETGKGSFVTLADGKFTFNQAGAGQTVTITANQAANYKYKAASLSRTFTIKGVQSLVYNNANLDVSVNADDKNVINLDDLQTSHVGDGAVTYTIKSGNGAVLSGNSFYSTVANTVVITATAANTSNYEACSTDFTVTVGKRTPTFEWWNADGATHIYASDVLENVAQAKYSGNDVDGLSYSYESNNGIVVVDGTTLRVQNAGFTSATNVTIGVSTEETDYYEAGSDTHEYLIEPKATPEFRLNDTINLPASPIQKLYLLVGETATMSFVNTDESNNRFTYPTNPTYVSYEHNSGEHTGVITAVKAGNEEIQFHQTGTTTIFDHLRNIHVYVSKHPVNLTTTLDGGTWKVDSIYDGAVYSIVAPTGDQPALSEVTVTSSDEAVLKKVDGHWKAVGEGTATLTISHPNTNDYWVDQTVTATITVVKHAPVITWNLDASYPWGAIIESPVSSSNEELPFTVVSNHPEIADYVNGQIEVYNKEGNVTFTLTQEGNYKWADATSGLTKTISAYKPNNHLPADLTAANYADYKKTQSGQAVWDDNCFKLGDGGVNEREIEVVVHFTGVPQKLTFDQSLDKIWGNLPGWPDCRIYQSANGQDWGEPIWYKSDRVESHNGVSLDLEPSTQYVKFEYNGSIYCRYKNIKITERHEVVATPTSLTFITADVDASAQTLPVKIDWYNVKKCTATIEGTNAEFFQLAETEPIEASLDHYGTKTLHITYAYPQAGTHTATLKVESEDGYKVEVPLSATSLKVTPAITWKENLTPMSRGENVTNPATSPVTLSYSSSDETVVAVEGNELKPLKKGEATITASFDGSSDLKWNSVSESIDVMVTDMHVQHINWPQTFTRLKYTTDPALSDKNTEDFPLTATVSYYDLDNEVEVVLDRMITFTSGNESVVKVSEGNILHVVGLGETTLSAHVEGVENEYLEATVTRKVKVREPSTDCDTYIIEDQSASMATGVTSFTGEQTIIDLQGKEPGSVSFSAWREAIRVLGVNYTNGDLYLAQKVNGQWSNDLWHNELEVDNPKDFGPIALDRHATQIKIYKKTGSTGIHAFSDCNVTLARYLELDNTEGKTEMDLYFSTEDAKPGVAKTKSFTVNYSNITDQLVVELSGSNKFSVTPTTIGEECGDKGSATVQVTFLSDDVDHYEATLTIHNENQSVTVHLSADVDKHNQQITWNPATELKTTDEVTFNATTSASAAGLSVRYEVVEGDAATVDAETGVLTIIKSGNVTIQATSAGNDSYHDADPVSKTFTISKVTPTISVKPTAATMTLPNTNLSGCGLTGGEASVPGSFAWADNTINAALNNAGYTVIFTPENTDWYSTATCTVVVPVNKAAQAIVWEFDQLEMYCNAQITFDAYSNTGLAELPVSYSSSDETIAYVDGNNHLNIIQGGEVTITATQGGNAIYASAEPVSKTLTINRFAPTIKTLPNASTMKIGRVLSDASITGGLAELDGVNVEGSFAWVDGNTTVMDVAGTFSKQIVFTPSNTNYYEPVYAMKSVTVEKYAPEISQNLHGSDITYGQSLSASNLSGSLTATDIIKIPSEEVDGTYAWLQPSAVLNAGTQNATVRFTPANMDWYEVVDFPVQLTVNKASTEGLTVTGVSEILYGQILGEAVPVNTTVDPVHGGVVNGTMAWDESLNMEEYKEIGSHNVPVTLTVNDPNYISATLNGNAVLTVTSGFAFKGNNGTDWNDEGNWFGQEGLPGVNDPVLIMSDVIISGNVTVDAMTIRQDVTVTVQDGAVLTITSGDAVQRNEYGNLVVEQGGQIQMGSGSMHVKDFTLKASLGDAYNVGKSGQVRNPATLKVNGNAYFDLALDPTRECTYGWYDFTVPFPVNAATGITRYSKSTGEEVVIKSEVHYAIMDFSESRRVETGYGWKKFYGIMQPGQCYSITTNNEDYVYRFKMANGGTFNNTLSETLAYTETDDEVRGWNGLGNGTMAYADLSAAGIEHVQLYNHATNSYTPVNMSDYTYVVGSAFFVQAPAANLAITYSQNGASHTLRAPQRNREVEEFTLTLSQEDANIIDDRLFVSVSEDALDGYEIGRDLTKFGTPTEAKVAQVWVNAYDLKLCDIDMPLEGNNANCELGLFAPKAGQYILSVDEAPSDASLFLTFNGRIIWNLSVSPYMFDLSKGSTAGYGLKLHVNEVATDIEQTDDSQEAGVRKVLIDNQIYIITSDGAMYDLMGKCIKN